MEECFQVSCQGHGIVRYIGDTIAIERREREPGIEVRFEDMIVATKKEAELPSDFPCNEMIAAGAVV